MKTIKILLLFVAVLLFVATPMLAHATPRSLVAFTVTSGSITVVESRTADGIRFQTVTQSLTFTGGFVGASFQTIALIIISSTGQYIIHGKGVFTGTVEGSQPGTLNYSFSGTGSFNPYSQQGHLNFGHGSGGLEGLHAEGPYQSSSPVVTSLSLPVHFHPA